MAEIDVFNGLKGGMRVHHVKQRRHGLSTGDRRLVAEGTVTRTGLTADEGTAWVEVNWEGPDGGVQVHKPSDLVPADAPLDKSLDEMEYGFDCFISSDAKRLDGKIVTITTHPDPDWGKPEVRHERVRCMTWGGSSLLVLADGDPGPAADIYYHLIKTVEVHES